MQVIIERGILIADLTLALVFQEKIYIMLIQEPWIR